LQCENIQYVRIDGLGGFRKPTKHTTNPGWTNSSPASSRPGQVLGGS
jgi:hypothetical protein